jgi:CheY-like chemotaxis protein
MSKMLALVVVADPVKSAAEVIARSCKRFAAKSIVARTGHELLRLSAMEQPDLAFLSLELQQPDAFQVVRELRRNVPRLRIVATFRELTLPDMRRMTELGVEDLLPLPVDPGALERLLWVRFKITTRAFDRYSAALGVNLADGRPLGCTRNISEGGMLLWDVTQSIASGQSLLFELVPQDDKPFRVRGTVLAVEGQIPSPTWARIEFEHKRGSDHERLAAFLSGLGCPIPLEKS